MSITPPNVRSGVMAVAPKYERLRVALESSAKKIEGGTKTARCEVVDLQRQAIASVQECADIALRLAECLGDGACPRDITCLHLGDWNRCYACFNEQAGRFFDQAGKFITAVAASAEPGAQTLRKGAVARSNACDAFPERAASFTEAQRRVFELVITGLPNKLIAYEIGVAEATVKAHVSAVLRKLEVRTRAQVIALSSAVERNRTVGSERGELIIKNSWATMPGSKDPVAGAADSSAQRLVTAGPQVSKGSASHLGPRTGDART